MEGGDVQNMKCRTQNGFETIHKTPGILQQVRYSMLRRAIPWIEAQCCHFEHFLLLSEGRHLETKLQKAVVYHNHHHHHHKHPGLGHLARSVSRVTVALSIVSSVSQLFSFLVGCSEMILKGFGFMTFFAGVKASSFCIHLSCLVCCLSVFRGEWTGIQMA
jgi:hypothetical protein